MADVFTGKQPTFTGKSTASAGFFGVFTGNTGHVHRKIANIHRIFTGKPGNAGRKPRYTGS
jgi:hypothetical protein